ncbi:MAG: hypothetical protein ACM358_11875 [Gemmatimonadota bacterium]
MGFFDAVKTVGGGIAGGIKKITGMDDPGADAERMRKAMLAQQAGAAGGFADTAQQGYGQLGGEAAAQRDYLGRLSRGEDSVSAEQLRQSLQQNQAAQMSMAASASPQNAASTARLAAILASRQASGMSGAAAIAGLQERQAAHQALANMIMQQRGQDLNAALGSRQTAVSGYGAGMQGQPEKSWLEKYGPVIRDAASFAAGGGKPA